MLVTFPPGSQWPGLDVHDPGPEDVYVVRGTFRGLIGDDSLRKHRVPRGLVGGAKGRR